MPYDVGIVMPVYKQSDEFLTLALKSILRQSYRKFRMIVVFDGAPSHTRRLVRTLIKEDKRIQTVSFPQNRGIATALNRGFEALSKHSQIRYYTWVSSDNVYRKDFIYTLRHAIRRQSTHTGLVYSSFRFIGDDHRPIFDDAMHQRHFEWMNQPKENLLDACFIGPSFLYKRRHAERTGPYQMEPVEDYDFWLRLTEHCDIHFVPKVLMDYRTNSRFSVTRKLHTTSHQQHRRWRVGFQSALYQARMRRGVLPALSVIVPVGSGLGSVRSIDRLYDQTFSNTEILIVDLNPNAAESRHVRRVADPRVRYLPLPGADLRRAVRHAAQECRADVALLWTSTLRPDAEHIQRVMTNYALGSALHNSSALHSLSGQSTFPTYVAWEQGLFATHAL